MSIIIGIDCGATGAIAILDGQTHTGPLYTLYDMPIDMVLDGKVNRSRVNGYKLTQILNQFVHTDTAVVVERPQGFPIVTRNKITGARETIQPSATRMLSFGMQFGTVYGVAAALGLKVADPTPGEWKRATSVPADKAEARRIAQQRFPEHAALFNRVKDDGRAEATLIAVYGRTLLLSGKL